MFVVTPRVTGASRPASFDPSSRAHFGDPSQKSFHFVDRFRLPISHCLMMNTNFRKIIGKIIITCLALPALALPNEAHAQFTGNNQTNTISGAAINWAGLFYYVGQNYVFDLLLIQNAGVLSNNFGYIGYAAGANNNAAIVSGSGSVWRNASDLHVGESGSGNRLVISDQGKVIANSGLVGYNASSSNNNVTVTGPGSVWSSILDADHVLIVGDFGSGNSLIISNGGTAFSGEGEVGYYSSNNSVLVTGPGSVWSNRFGFYVGSSGPGNSLVISDQGMVSGSGGSVGLASSYNSVLVTGPGSVLSTSAGGLEVGLYGAGNRLVISNQGAVLIDHGLVGWDRSSTNNSVLVTGPASVLSSSGYLTVGGDGGGAGNSLVISNQGAVFNDYGYVGFYIDSNNNSVRVVDNGLWSNNSTLYVGYSGSSNVVSIAGGSVSASNVFIGYSNPAYGLSSNNVIRVDSGRLFVTNATGDGALVVSQAGGKGELILNGGSVTVDSLIATNDVNSVVTCNGGTLHTKATAVTNTQQFVVGNGTNRATFHLLGGVHSFNDGLRIRTDSFLTGCGTINGKVIIDPGGAVRADCSTLLFTGSVTNNGAMVADRAVLESSGTLVNNGKIILLHGGTTSFDGTFINNGMILNGDIQLAISRDGSGGLFIRFTRATNATYRLQRAPDLAGPWTTSSPQTASASGLVEFWDLFPPPGQAFYRTVQP